ncbi:MAG: hypothetical protein ACRC1M_04560 [Methanobacteriaceae archaeon]
MGGADIEEYNKNLEDLAFKIVNTNDTNEREGYLNQASSYFKHKDLATLLLKLLKEIAIM